MTAPGGVGPSPRDRAGTLSRAVAAGPVLLDGGLATELERAGHDVSSALWSAALLRDDPAAVAAAHRAFFAAGAQVATTASYQATRPGFAAAGIDADEADRLTGRSVALARQAGEEAGRGRWWVAGSVGPYGAMLADGSEYTGAYAAPGWLGRAGGGLSVAELRAFHRPRMTVLASAGADLLACETVPAAAEAEALVAEVQSLGLPAWLSLTTLTGPDGGVRTRLGEPAGPVFALAAGVDEIVAVGINCTDPAGVGAAVALAASASGKPVVAYPNSGEQWDAAARSWTGAPGLSPADVTTWVGAGARLVGGCCRVGPGHIRLIGTVLAG